MIDYDIEAKVVNCRESKNSFNTGYRPAFQIHKEYLTTGEITLIGRDYLEYNNEAISFIRFLTPEVYPNSVWIGKKIIFKEGKLITGYAIVTKIFNKILESPIDGNEADLNFKVRKN